MIEQKFELTDQQLIDELRRAALETGIIEGIRLNVAADRIERLNKQLSAIADQYGEHP